MHPAPVLRAVLALSFALLGTASAAQPPDAAGEARSFEQTYRVGQKVAAFCANCHGQGGNSVKPDVPNLAGQNPVYLLEQVRQFADGRRKNLFMEGLMRALSNDEKSGVAVYYAAQEVQPQPVRDAALVARGKTYYDKSCFRCHGEGGLGGDRFARIAGQQPEYLMVTLKRYRDGSATRADPLMAANTRLMSDMDMRAVVAYVASMR